MVFGGTFAFDKFSIVYYDNLLLSTPHTLISDHISINDGLGKILIIGIFLTIFSCRPMSINVEIVSWGN